MKINSVNNYSNIQTQKNNPQFKARFSQTQLKEMLSPKNRWETDKNMYEFIPKLYTLLERLDKIKPGELAVWNYLPNKNNCKFEYIEIGGKNIRERKFNPNYTEVDVLEKELIDGCSKSQCLYKDRAFMPKSIYEQKWWSNLDKTAEDIVRDFSYKIRI